MATIKIKNAQGEWVPVHSGGGASILDIVGQMIREQTTPDIGDYIVTAKDASPAVKWPGTVWEKLPEGTFLMAAGATTPVGTTGGAASVALTAAQNGRHGHVITNDSGLGVFQTSGSEAYGCTLSYGGQKGCGRFYAQSDGSGQPHENRPPFVAANIWRRTA